MDDRRWVSLGMLFGGHSCDIPSLFGAPRSGKGLAPEWDPAAQLDEALWEAQGAGFDPDEDYPGEPDRPWRLVCRGCGTPLRASLTALRGGTRCGCEFAASP
ncbi:hypothetical protein ACFV27_01145 [Streptomyces antimycoticus]|uniref:hypothetical protein n=1 Tax=Streptomyces antimycoticus TaxID=68175 RepID=UPI0036CC8CA5